MARSEIKCQLSGALASWSIHHTGEIGRMQRRPGGVPVQSYHEVEGSWEMGRA